MSKKRVAIVYGGYQSEAEVSARSKDGLLNMIDGEVYDLTPVEITRESWTVHAQDGDFPISREDFSYTNSKGEKVTFDMAYITIHGIPGENGLLTAYFEMIGQKHSTCPSLTGAMTFDKFVCNSYLRAFGVNVADSIRVRGSESVDPVKIAERIGLPMFIKPSAAGSSFGVSKVKVVDEILPAIEKAKKESEDVLIEEYMEGTELTCGLYKTGKRTVVFPLTEVVTKREFFDTEAKYTPGMTEEITPARVSDEVAKAVMKIAQEVYDLLNMRGIVRIDFIVRKNGAPYVLEINTTPGQTVTSFIPQQIRAAGMKESEVFGEVIDDLIEKQ
ncbi:MAG: D-alanine--D-alanine ligase [Bacteroidales bacterium]|nr:D-alanine--D-alanine ligase [Bacteroidales bacterium]